MKIKKAVITAAGEKQRLLPLQTLVDTDGEEKSVLGILIELALAAHIEEVCVVIWPGDEARYGQAAARHLGHVRFVPQPQPLGYGHAVYCAREFLADEPFLHLVGDHLWSTGADPAGARQLLALAGAEKCSVSAVQVTRESLLPRYGAVGARRLAGRQGLYRIDAVLEKPTPTEAEQRLTTPGLRAGHYLCFFGMHALTPAVMDLLEKRLAEAPDSRVSLSPALDELARREKYLALEEQVQRYDIGARYGLLTAQLALALGGRDRAEVLAQLVELLAAREMGDSGGGAR
ncbi:MAG TPA: sugar phosphate nucleotidyltransferase [Bryobacteraceae bacterium]|nr:sugar phosphate nucleotidyltransferase [Bryobacteraceae bacterium]